MNSTTQLVMKHAPRTVLRFLLGIGIPLALLLPLNAQPTTPTTDSTTPISALWLDPQQFSNSLDAGNLAEAIVQLEQGWRQQLNEYYGRHFRTEILSPDQIAQSLRQNQQTTGQQSALIYAVSTDEQLEVILLLPDGQMLHHRVTEATAEVLADTAQKMRLSLANVTAPPQQYLPPAQQLYDWIIEPLRPALEAQGVDNLIFCLGGGLRSIPMVALHDGQNFLMTQYSVGIIPAFNLLDRRPAQLAEAQVLAMGASEFQTQMPLPAVPIELAAITQLWPGDVSLNQAFTLENLKAERSRHPFSIVHLATHANFAPGEAQGSYIQFWNRRLGLDQLRQMSLQTPMVELLVLSACRTALGDPNAELGFAGLAVQSGAKSALASWWSIPDTGTFVFMTGFYQALLNAPTKSEALRQTQLAMLEGTLTLDSDEIQPALRGIAIPDRVINEAAADLSHPYYWAGFTMIGNPW